MKTIKLKYIGFWDGFQPGDEFIFNILTRYYNVEIVSEDPDYIICSVFGEPYEYCKYPQIRIMYSGENYVPDFNLIDYAISPYPIQYYDRNFYKPMFIDEFGSAKKLCTGRREYPDDFLSTKTRFANMIAGHESENGIRGAFFNKLSTYKRVDSAGSYLNNMPSGETVSRKDESKYDFQRECKFTFCPESTSHYGFVTEKIVHAFYADSIPIYYGSDNISEIFNPKAFINLKDYPDLDSALARIIELDQNDDEYMRMMQEPIFLDPDYIATATEELEKFVLHIFEQPIESAYRRSRYYMPRKYETFILDALRMKGSFEDGTCMKWIPGRKLLAEAMRRAINKFK